MRVPISSVRVPMAEDFHQDEVHDQADRSDDEHQFAIDASRWIGLQSVDEPHHRFVQQHTGEHPDHQHTRDGTDDLRALKAEAQSIGGRSLVHPDREKRDADARHVRQHVRRVRHDGQTAGQVASDDLGAHEKQRKQAGELQFALSSLVALGHSNRRETSSSLVWRFLKHGRSSLLVHPLGLGLSVMLPSVRYEVAREVNC
ncbi:hypothetical protein ON010_g16120 [Phytophthora cinnamomi]|nr:hypothetical protein ON010_g16120 [Phytophthora cinnamomi]